MSFMMGGGVEGYIGRVRPGLVGMGSLALFGARVYSATVDGIITCIMTGVLGGWGVRGHVGVDFYDVYPVILVLESDC